MYALTILARLYGLTWSDYIYALTWSDYIYALTWSDSLKIVLSWRNNIGRTRISRWLRLGIVVAGLPPLLGGNFDPLYCPSAILPIRPTATSDLRQLQVGWAYLLAHPTYSAA